jgi:uncharacterized protein (TIGR01777 family)
MKVLITGGTGFVGTHLCRELLRQGHEVQVISRSPGRPEHLPEGTDVITGDPTRPGAWQDQVAQCDAVINLAGASIFTYWSGRAKQNMYDSRILTTRRLVEALEARSGRRTVLINASAVGYYGPRDDDLLVEEEGLPGSDFLARLAQDWEAEARRASDYGVRVVLCRFGIVLGKEGGALAKMLPAFRKWLGSPLGSGKQWFPWIHEQDLANIMLFALQRDDLDGPINCVAPYSVRNRELTETLAKTLKRSVLLPPVPSLLLRTVLGEFGSVLLTGQRVFPRRLLSKGFQFGFPTLQEALADLISGGTGSHGRLRAL